MQVEDLTGTYWGRSKTPTNSAGEFSKTVKFRNPASARDGLIGIYEINPIDNSLKLLAAQEVRLGLDKQPYHFDTKNTSAEQRNRQSGKGSRFLPPGAFY